MINEAAKEFVDNKFWEITELLNSLKEQVQNKIEDK